jgi:hypothetical protein
MPFCIQKVMARGKNAKKCWYAQLCLETGVGSQLNNMVINKGISPSFYMLIQVAQFHINGRLDAVPGA